MEVIFLAIQIEKFIKDNEFREITSAEQSIANRFFSNYPDKSYGILSDTFLIKYGSKIYYKKLPFNFDNETILTTFQRQEKRKRDYKDKQTLFELFNGIHVFLSVQELNKISQEATIRSIYKKQEHRICDDRNDNKRITTGTISEKAVEILTKTKTTDFSAPSLKSSNFQVADNTELSIGVKGSDEYNVYTIIETPAPYNEIICTNIKRHKRKGAHVCCRGFVKKDDLNNPEYKTRNVITDNGLLAKSILAQTKTGFAPKSEIIVPFYSINEINFNVHNNRFYDTFNIAFEKNIDFRNLSANLTKNFESIVKNSKSTIIYVHMNSIGLKTLKQLPYFYENPNTEEQEERIIALENFAMKYGLGVVFYDDFHKKALKTQYAPKNDKYLYALMYSDGHILPLRKTVKENVN
jgi:hypothetical protein